MMQTRRRIGIVGVVFLMDLVKMQTRKCLKGENIPFRYKQKSNLLLGFRVFFFFFLTYYLFFKIFKRIYIKNKNIDFL